MPSIINLFIYHLFMRIFILPITYLKDYFFSLHCFKKEIFHNFGKYCIDYISYCALFINEALTWL